MRGPWEDYQEEDGPWNEYKGKQEASSEKAEANGIQRFLPTVGSIVGGTLATPATVIPGVGTAIRSGSAGLGAGFGEALNQIISRARGQEAPSTSGESAKRIAKQAGTAAATEAVVPAVVRGAGKAIQASKPAARVVGKGLAKVGEVVTGVPERMFRRLANDPSALFILKTLKSAGKELDEVLKREGIDISPSAAERNDPQLATARRIAKGFYGKLKNGIQKTVQKSVPVTKQSSLVDEFGKPISRVESQVVDETVTVPFQPTPADILKARRATDRIIAGTPWKDKTGLRNLYKQRTDLNQRFENASGPGAEAAKKYARSALASQFRKLMPETQTGKISFVKSVALPFLARSVFGNVLSAPITAGLVTSLGSYGVRGAVKAAESELATRALLNAITQKVSRKNDGK